MSQPPRSASRLPLALAATAAGAVLLGFLVFRTGRSADNAQEWTPADHDQAANAPIAPPGKAPPRPQEHAENPVEMAWARQGPPCHGPQGRGDGPQGRMMGAPDLTRADWQGRVTDQDILQTIHKGRNKMPAFE